MLTTSRMSVFHEIFISLPPSSVTEEFLFPLKWLRPERKGESGKHCLRKADKPQLHLVLSEPGLSSYMTLYRSFLFRLELCLVK